MLRVVIGGIGGGFPAADGMKRPVLMAPIPGMGSDGIVRHSMQALTGGELQQLAAPLLQSVREQVTQAIAPIQQENAALRQRMDQLSQPQRSAGFLMGGAPGVRTGEDPLTSRGYSFQRLCGLLSGAIGQDQCKVELGMHQRLSDLFQREGFRQTVGQSILVPLSGSYVDSFDHGLAMEVRQSMRAGVTGLDPNELQWIGQRVGGVVRQALSQYDDTGLGVLLGPTQQGELIELLRAREAVSAAGATQIALPPNGRLQFPRAQSAATAHWLGEVPSDKSSGSGLTDSSPTTGYLTLMAKKLGCFVKSPNELIRFANPTVEAFIRNDIAQVMGLASDLSMLEGAGTGRNIKGLLNFAVQPHVAGTVATDGDTFEPSDVAAMLAKLEEANVVMDESTSWLMRPAMWHTGILERRVQVLDDDDVLQEVGAYLFSVNRNDVSQGKPMNLRGAKVVTSTQVSRSRVKGSGTNLSYILLGAFRDFLVGRVGVMEFATSTQGDTPFLTDQTWIRAIQHIDAGPRHEESFVLCDQLAIPLV